MAKKFVRGVTGVDDIESFDKTLTNVNDIISDGQNTYVHTKKGKVESYYNLTDNLKTITSNSDYIKIEKNEAQSSTLINSEKISQKFATVDSALLTKQNSLMAGAGVQLKDNIISVIHVPQSTVDCNKVITTQYLKVGNASTNLPSGVEMYGILTVVRIGDVIEQTYQDYKGNGRYVRTCYQADTYPKWTVWQKIVTQPVS